MTPRVSVAITTYNQAAYIGDTIKSVLDQTYVDREVIVVDDGSTDATPQVIGQFGDAVRNIRQVNRGVAGARNRAVDAARGELIAFLDGDDLWKPTKLAKQVALFDQHPDVGLLACDAMHFSETRTLWERSLSWTIFVDNEAPHVAGDFYEQFLTRNPISTTSQIMIPAKVLAAVGRSRETLAVGSDFDLYLRISRRYPVAFLNDVLTCWRFLETSVSGRDDLRLLRWKTDELAALRGQEADAPAHAAALIQRRVAELEAEVAWGAYEVGCRGGSADRRLARACLWPIASRGHVRPAAYYAALCLPAAVHRAARSTMSRLRSSHPAERVL
jgi:glycosyltransferase involved in cell wall biosynthesis